MKFENRLWQTQNWERFSEKNFRVGGILVQKKTVVGFKFLEIARGKLTAKIFRKLEKIAAQQNYIFLRFASADENLPNFLREKFWRKSGRKTWPVATRFLNLQKPLDEIQKEFSTSGRRHLKIARRENLEIKFEKNGKILAELSRKLETRKNLKMHDENFFTKILREFKSDAFLISIWKNSQPAAAALFASDGKTVTYLFGASDFEFAKTQAATLLQFTAIQTAQKRGGKFFDFFGVAPPGAKNHPWEKISQFKRKFGGEEISYFEEIEIPFSKFRWVIFRFLKFLRELFARR